MSNIADIKSHEILDSRGNPTIETTIFLDNGINASASIPSGASVGSHEAVELRDGDTKRYHGMGVLKAIDNLNTKIKAALVGKDITNQKEIDQLMIELDGTENKRNIGANAILSVSLSCARLAAKASNKKLYSYLADLYGTTPSKNSLQPMFNVVNGGLHGSGSFNFQEFLIIPDKNYSIDEAIRIGAEIYQSTKKFLKNKSLNYSVGDEGGFTPQMSTNEEVLELIIEVIQDSSYSFGEDIFLGLDLAATTFYLDGNYELIKKGKKIPKEEYINYLDKLVEKYNLYSLEDCLYEDDWKGWSTINKRIGNKVLIIGDDLLVTNKNRLKKAIDKKACSGIIIKPNQIGTLTETLEVIKLAKDSNFKIIVSHRSGETNDSFTADLAFAVGADYVKFGAPARGERVAKYNRLMGIYHELMIHE